MTIKVGVLGANGRMGKTVCEAVSLASDLDLVCALDVDGNLADLAQSGAEVVVDFTVPTSVLTNLEYLAANNIHAVVGTTGFDSARLAKVNDMFSKSKANVLIAPNFGVGAVLMMKFAAMAAPHFENIEIVELHHPRKVDAPSSEARKGSPAMPDATSDALDGARGAKVAGVPIHSIRAQGLVAHQEVIFGGLGETLTIRHDSLDRESFMPGVLLAIRKISETKGVTFGLEGLLGL
jgi:4-hydroxy-tetrahydrodipicolinate reductase